MTAPRIVIVTYNWPPRNAIGTHRPYAWARHWAALGARVTVLTAQKQEFDAPLDLDLPPLKGVTVIEVPFGHSSARLAGRLLRNDRLRSYAKALRNWVSRRRPTPVEVRGAWFEAALPQAQRLAAETDVVVSTFGPSMAHRLGHAIKIANPSALWVADYRDLWSQSYLADLSPAQRATLRQFERNLVGAHADLLTAVSADMVRQLTELTGKQVLLFPNGFDLDEDSLHHRLAQPAPPLTGPLRIVYTGMLYPGHRDPEPLLCALAELVQSGDIPAGAVTVDFYGARIDVARDLARSPDYAPLIRLIGHVPRDAALTAQAEADLLLLLESPEPEARGTLTGKLFEYIAACRPILLLGSRHDYEIAKVLRETGTGLSFERQESDQLKTFLRGFIAARSVAGFYQPKTDSILRYSRKRQALDIYAEFIR